MSVFVNLSICLFVFFNLSVTDKGAASTGRLAGTEVLFIQLAGWFEILTLLIAFECVAVSGGNLYKKKLPSDYD